MEINKNEYYVNTVVVLNKEIYKDKKIYAIIGTREPNRYEKDIAYNLGRRFAIKDIVVITGGANGIDYYATDGCLRNGGNVIWVLAKFKDDILIPQKNFDYALNNIENGLDIIIIDYIEELTLKQQYLERNIVILETATKIFIPMYYDDCMKKKYGVYKQIKNNYLKNKNIYNKDNNKKFIFMHDIIRAIGNSNIF